MSEKQEYVEKASEYEKADSDFEADFDFEDTQVPEHPVVLDVRGMGKASAHIVSWELVEDIQNEGDGEEYVFGADKVAEIIRNHYVSPSFDNLRGDDVRTMKLSVPDALLGAIMPGMETSMNQDGSATVDTKNV